MKSTSSVLRIHRLTASIGKKEILHGLSIAVRSGEVHAIMGPNGSGKSTLASVLLGHPAYTVAGQRGKTASKIVLDGKNIIGLTTEARAIAGLFLAFQSPIAISGVTVMNLLRASYQARYHRHTEHAAPVQNPVLARRSVVGGMPIADFMHMVSEYAGRLHLDEALLRRGIHDGFSGGEKKKIEMLQAMVLKPKFAVFDEIDTGLDVDALRAVALGISVLRKERVGIIIITHYQRILKYVHPDYVHILVAGKIVKTGKAALAKQIEDQGYSRFL